jgi:hypothetical protein
MAQRLVGPQAVCELLLDEAHDVNDEIEHHRAMQATPSLKRSHMFD